MYRNDVKIKSKRCMGGPEGLRRGTGRVKDTSGVVLDEFWSFLGVDFGAKNELFPE